MKRRLQRRPCLPMTAMGTAKALRRLVASSEVPESCQRPPVTAKHGRQLVARTAAPDPDTKKTCSTDKGKLPGQWRCKRQSLRSGPPLEDAPRKPQEAPRRHKRYTRGPKEAPSAIHHGDGLDCRPRRPSHNHIWPGARWKVGMLTPAAVRPHSAGGCGAASVKMAGHWKCGNTKSWIRCGQKA